MTASDGVDIVWAEFGPSDGRSVVLCHGLAAGGAQFFADAQALAEMGYRVIVPDLRGHGASGKPDPGELEHYGIERMARDLIEVFDTAGLRRVDFVGNSLGGILALSLLPVHEGRFRTLVTFGTAPILNLPASVSRLMPLLYLVLGPKLTSWSTAMLTTPSKTGRAIVSRLIADFDPEIGRAIATHVRRYDLLANALAYSGPYLVMQGTSDDQVNLALEPMLKQLLASPSIEHIRLERAGHCANLDQPEAFRETLCAFWSRHPQAAANEYRPHDQHDR